jgi:hypothetical protein
MSIIPLDVQRRCERRWAARFSRPTEPVAPRNQRPEREGQQSPRPTRAKEKPAGVKRRVAEPHSSQIYFSDRPQRLHRKVMKPGLVSLTSCPATIMSVPQSRHAGSSPVSKG